MSKKTLNTKSNHDYTENYGSLKQFIVEKKISVYAEEIIATVRESLLVLDMNLKVAFANKFFYRIFKVNPQETIGRFIYDLGNGQWNIPKLKQLLEDILPKNNNFEDYEVEHNFETIGQKTMLLNARRIPRPPAKPKIILLAIEDATAEKAIKVKLANYTKNLEKGVAEKTSELKARIDELSKLNKLMVGRELKMAELKEEIKELKN